MEEKKSSTKKNKRLIAFLFAKKMNQTQRIMFGSVPNEIK